MHFLLFVLLLFQIIHYFHQSNAVEILYRKSSNPVSTLNLRTTRNLLSNDTSKKSHFIRPGVIVLGMHRSGTSVLGGLLLKMGLKSGEIVGAGAYNLKGYFER